MIIGIGYLANFRHVCHYHGDVFDTGQKSGLTKDSIGVFIVESRDLEPDLRLRRSTLGWRLAYLPNGQLLVHSFHKPALVSHSLPQVSSIDQLYQTLT